MNQEYLAFAKQIAFYAGETMLKSYQESLALDFKEDKTVVTKVDKEINAYLIDCVKKAYPTHGVIGEEESFNPIADFVWICDPLDGTGMYTNHIPVFVFSLALVYKGEPIVGVVYNPSEDNLYTAIKDKGAYLNETRLEVNQKRLGDLGYRTNVEIFHNELIDEVSLIKELKEVSKISSIGSVARSGMAIASGYFSCDIFPGGEHGNCDIAATSLIVTEAGGKVTDFYGENQSYDKAIKGGIISNGVSHDQVLEVVKKYLLKK